MKKILIGLTLLASMSSFACQTDTVLMNSDPATERLVKRVLGEDVKLDQNSHYNSLERKAIRLYPTIMDRVALSSIGGMAGTSCEVQGPNGERLVHGATTMKGDYRYDVTLLDGSKCTIDLFVKEKVKRVKVKFLKTSCEISEEG
ncbi:MAG: hypothetical protein HON90_12590 [Halobacteriovoraceae bacterium]|jgi:hypothetical protein|nr:hypothetical protein [Candidatus Falkowbacteria bacterium]MBT4792401.1 hypothetical protein [Halobacteriovoraceae bacterium]